MPTPSLPPGQPGHVSPDLGTLPPTQPLAEQATTPSDAGMRPAEGAAESPPLTRSSGLLVSGYEILGELGRGGMGVVYQARQVGLNRTVALKMVLSAGHASDADVARFCGEAEAVARLQHPNIVQVFEVGQAGAQPFFSMEFCPGGSLDRKLRGTPLPGRDAARLVEVLARAMHTAHEAGVIHRDLKPANVLLAADGTPKITDFGLAKRLDDTSGRTQTGSILGTPSYMAPEQAEGRKDIGPAADLYALGAILYDLVQRAGLAGNTAVPRLWQPCWRNSSTRKAFCLSRLTQPWHVLLPSFEPCLLYELLTGRPPFRAATPLETVLQVVADDPAPPRRLNPGVPRDLEAICLKCLNKDPRRRYPDAAALADDLGRFQQGEPVSAQESGLFDRLAGALDRVQFRAEFAVYGSLLLWLAPLMFLPELWITAVVWNDWPSVLLGMGQFSRAAGFVLVVGYHRGWRWRPEGAAERQLWAVWGGYLLACFALGVSGRIAFGSFDTALELQFYPGLAALTALAFFSLAANFWGYCAVIALGFVGLSFVMAADLWWASLEFGLAWAAVLVLLGTRLRRLGGART